MDVGDQGDPLGRGRHAVHRASAPRIRPGRPHAVREMFQSRHGSCPPTSRRARRWRRTDDDRCRRDRSGTRDSRRGSGRGRRRPERPPRARACTDHVHQVARPPVAQHHLVEGHAAAGGRQLAGRRPGLVARGFGTSRRLRDQRLREGPRLAARRAVLATPVRRLRRQPDPRPGLPALRQALRERDPAPGAVHPHRGRRRQRPVRRRAGRPDLSVGVPEDQRLHVPRVHQDGSTRHPRPDPRLPPLLQGRRPLPDVEGVPGRPHAADPAFASRRTTLTRRGDASPSRRVGAK